mmetsp:Transcript_13242/g.30125  ORF Transcript_13242/g.30125 Transcript_13242/m.30125 type:complete len:408 (+) Transcript_13242:48-1271(+)
MAPKKKEEPKVEEQPEEPAEPEPPVVHQKYFKSRGQVYYGSCIAGTAEGTFVRHGFGCLVATAKTVNGRSVQLGSYEGNWENDVMQGNGTYSWPDGSSYEGGFFAGRFHGFGRFEWPEGSVYEGTWVNGEMTGQGRYDSRFDGSFQQGRYHRDCYQTTGGKWTNVREDHEAEEVRRILTGEPASLPITAFDHEGGATIERLEEQLAQICNEGRVPFLISDSAFAGLLLEGRKRWACIDIDKVASARKRNRDHKRILYEGLQAALVNDQHVALHLHDANFGEKELPASWMIQTFFDPMSFPVQVFHPKFFNTRGLALRFLPPPPAPSSACEQDEQESAPAAEEEIKVPPPAEEPLAYLLQPIVTVSWQLPGELEDADQIRELLVARYSAHLPLHQLTAVVLCKSLSPN